MAGVPLLFQPKYGQCFSVTILAICVIQLNIVVIGKQPIGVEYQDHGAAEGIVSVTIGTDNIQFTSTVECLVQRFLLF